MAIDLLLNLDDETFAAYAAAARRAGSTMEEVLRKVICEAAGEPYVRPSGRDLLSAGRPHLMLDLTC